ncbi:hypothetical protein IWW50_005919, partial [Coemansia erecta]
DPQQGLGAQDLVHTLEREFPALGLQAQQADAQSISSLSVQASGGARSEVHGADGSGARGEPLEPLLGPPGMLGPHMVLPDGAVVPGLAGAGQMPLGMVPMGFHPGMMYMPPPPMPGMYGMPPMQMGGDQLMLMKMMMPDMYGQMGAAAAAQPGVPHMPAHSFGMQYPNMQMTMPPDASASQAPGPAFPPQSHHQHQQHRQE